MRLLKVRRENPPKNAKVQLQGHLEVHQPLFRLAVVLVGREREFEQLLQQVQSQLGALHAAGSCADHLVNGHVEAKVEDEASELVERLLAVHD